MTKLTRKQAREIRALQRMKDEEIDFTDIPLTVDWSKAVVGKYYRLAEPFLSPAAVSKPRPRILVGGSGERKTLKLVARYADAGR